MCQFWEVLFFSEIQLLLSSIFFLLPSGQEEDIVFLSFDNIKYIFMIFALTQ